LTDFEELAIYDCTLKPALTDSASKGRINYYTYEQYVDKWDEIEELFSKKAVLKGSFDRFADKKKRGTTTVDEDFLLEIEKWRQTLASSIFKHNNITPRNLNYAVQMTIDRIIFLRICEDRGIEPYGRLEKLKNSKDIYKKLIGIFKDADDKYNSGLFHFDENEKGYVSERDRMTLKLKIEDAPLQEMLSSLYFPNPYEFSVIPADILGQVYERFLGKVIDVVGKNVIIEEKPEVKKSGGVFYTPTYIVDYIVKHTLEQMLGTKTPKQVEKLRILDPACGSGSFLIVAFQRLLDWHLAYYEANGGLAKFKRVLQPTQTGGVRLTTTERKRILLANIYGVDIDSQAVEVTKLSLLLKVLEGESSESINSQFKLFHERALPDLGSNIKCGNSLVGSDFYAQANLPELSE
ncbi:MAG: restriction endonuclease subunit M, partial [Chryseobacterium sp.]